MNKKSLIFVILVCSLLLLAACATGEAGKSKFAKKVVRTSPLANPTVTKTVTIGQEVDFTSGTTAYGLTINEFYSPDDDKLIKYTLKNKQTGASKDYSAAWDVDIDMMLDNNKKATLQFNILDLDEMQFKVTIKPQ